MKTSRLGLDTNAVWVDARQMMTTRTSDTQTQTIMPAPGRPGRPPTKLLYLKIKGLASSAAYPRCSELRARVCTEAYRNDQTKMCQCEGCTNRRALCFAFKT